MSGFRRLVLELGHGGADRATMRQAAAFAQLLDAELHALYVEDESLLHASALPFAREISALSYQWRRLEPERLEAELRAAADRARRQFVETVRTTRVRHTFEIRRGDLALSVTETRVASDIVVVAVRRRDATHGSDRLRETAHLSAASVLYLPPTPGRRQGPIVAVVTGAGDPAQTVAESIAALGHEPVLVLSARSAEEIIAVLGDTRERLIVLTRDDGSEERRVGKECYALCRSRWSPYH